MTYDCMTPEELALWRSSIDPPKAPCTDCTIAFHLAEKAAGRCFRESPGTLRLGRPPKPIGRPRIVGPAVPLLGKGGYATEEERRAARRQSWRDSKRRRAEQARRAALISAQS